MEQAVPRQAAERPPEAGRAGQRRCRGAFPGFRLPPAGSWGGIVSRGIPRGRRAEGRGQLAAPPQPGSLRRLCPTAGRCGQERVPRQRAPLRAAISLQT